MQVDDRDPFAMLVQSHRRLRERMDDLERAAVELAGGAGREAAEAIDDVLGYLERSAARHERDEEESLFPRLGADEGLRGVIETLAGQHREHERIAAELGSVLDRGREDDGAAERLLAIARRLRAAYDAHIVLEEEELFPKARALLDASALDAIASEMAARRGRGGRRDGDAGV